MRAEMNNIGVMLNWDTLSKYRGAKLVNSFQ